ncbi:MAG: NitT/TauT family transport system substrate-binding protein [Alphaproteobacteria bacterium]|jgi:NitT/TauT family transport system substrate-binding protein|nr:NitT/TauT family transport system substrate-binding protein [Alphaproteobacteria bacterium]
MKPYGALLLALVLSLGVPSAHAQTPVPWRQGAVQPKGDAGFWWMTAEGGFAKQQGLDLKMLAFNSDVLMIKALLAGELDSFEGSPISPMIATSKGGDLKIVGCTWPKLTYSFFSHQDVRSLGDLKGKTIGISAPGSLPDLVARAMLGRIAIAPEDVKFVVAGSDAERVRAVAAKTIDAAVSTSDFAARPELRLRTLARANDILPSFLRACIITRGEVWRKRPDDLVRLLAATMNAYGYALTHRAETIALARRIASLSPGDPTPGANFDEVTENHSVSPTLDIDETKLLWLRDLLAEDGRIDPDFEPGTMIDRGIRERALARIKGN